ncbi:MAG: transcriptional regulator [Candidatus Methanomethylophilaceae archaeon]|nr:transcriptional regulator [Candidatus Methanomethylophilaceae archaeon]
MKIPCEIIVWSVLPMIRREMARELVTVHGMPQAEVARRFGVTDAAVSQYLRKKRGVGPAFEEGDEDFACFMEILKESAGRIAEQGSDPAVEMCRLCGAFKRLGLLEKACRSQNSASGRCDFCRQAQMNFS